MQRNDAASLAVQTVQLCVSRNYGGLITSSIFKLVQTPIAAIGQAQLPFCVIYTALLRTLLPTGVCCKVYAVKQFANSNVQVALCSNIIDAQMKEECHPKETHSTPPSSAICITRAKCTGKCKCIPPLAFQYAWSNDGILQLLPTHHNLPFRARTNIYLITFWQKFTQLNLFAVSTTTEPGRYSTRQDLDALLG